MTDREVFEHLYRAYADPDPADKIKAIEEAQRQAESEYMKRTLDQRKTDYYEMCRRYGFKDVQIDAKWQKYLKTGSTE